MSDIPLLVTNPNWVDGVPYMELSTPETLANIRKMRVYDDDVYVTGYPKSGKANCKLNMISFLAYTLYQLLHCWW